MDTDTILWLVTHGRGHYITLAIGRERAKRNAQYWFGGDPDTYTVTPLTAPGDTLHIGLSISM